MQILLCSDPSYQKKLKALYTRPACPREIEESVRPIVEDVRANGDAAIVKYLKKFDSVDLQPKEFLVSPEEYREAEKQVDAASKRAIRNAIAHIRAFAKMTLPKAWSKTMRPGVVLGEKFTPMDRIGCYVPGGTAPLVSTSLHTAAIAHVAGVKEIAAATPPMKNGKINPATLYALKQAGATEIYKIGGVSAIAAFAYGTKTIRKVEKIVGPGNAYVAAAKKFVYGAASIDMVAGPSEILVLVDDSVNPAFAAADVLSQAEHGSGLEQAVLVSTSKKVLDAVHREIDRQKKLLTRQGPLTKVLEKGVFLIEAADLDAAFDIASEYAPEHLELMCRNPRAAAKKIRSAGAIFMGPWTPEPAGDFTAGPSHVLPTGGTAKFFHGISGSDFMRRSSLLQYTKSALMKELPDIEKFASLEGLDAHGRSASIRKEGK